MTTFRTCPQCSQAVTGRADKIYCDAAFRAQQADNDEAVAPADLPTVRLPAPAAPPAWDPMAQRTLITEAIAQSLQQHAAQQAQQQQQELQELHTRYTAWVQHWLDVTDQPLTVRAVRQHLKQVVTLVTCYRAHPGLAQPAHPVRQRLQLVDQLRDALRALAQELAVHPPGFAFFGRRRPPARWTCPRSGAGICVRVC